MTGDIQRATGFAPVWVSKNSVGTKVSVRDRLDRV